jgi:hypothetical protein
MRQAAIVLIVGFILLTFAGTVLANETAGTITALDAAKGAVTLKNGAQFDSVALSLLKDLKVGDHIKVEYKEEGGKKVVTKITPPPIGC